MTKVYWRSAAYKSASVSGMYYICVMFIFTAADDLLSAFDGSVKGNGFEGSQAPPSYDTAKELLPFPRAGPNEAPTLGKRICGTV